MLRFLLAILVLVMAGCAHTRDPQPTPLHQTGDDNLTCEQIFTEYRSNTQIAEEKIQKNRKDDGKDVLVGFFIWPGLADFKNADGTEGNALLDRNIHLKNMAIAKGCDCSSLPEQPERYQ